MRCRCIAEGSDGVVVPPRPRDRQTLEAFLFDAFLARFGTRHVAEAHLAALYASLQRLQGSSRKVRAFARLLGIADPYPEVRFAWRRGALGRRLLARALRQRTLVGPRTFAAVLFSTD